MRIQKLITLLLLACLPLMAMGQGVITRQKKDETTTDNTRKDNTRKDNTRREKPTPKPEPKPVPKLTGYISGHEYVDLGLPSGLKWATMNVGASSPSDYGNYYAWGETSTKAHYSQGNSTSYGKKMADISGSSYDAARTNWGGSWRLPTAVEFGELLTRCTWTWTGLGGHYGYMVTGPNGRRIFLPAAGWRDGSSLEYAGLDGRYWSSTPYEDISNNAYFLYFYSEYRRYTSTLPCFYGFSVRAVSK